MEEKKVFIVYGSDFDQEFEPEKWILFTSYEEALSYTNRYKENSKFEIKELDVDLDYILN